MKPFHIYEKRYTLQPHRLQYPLTKGRLDRVERVANKKGIGVIHSNDFS
jgi:hypothetical protein